MPSDKPWSVSKWCNSQMIPYMMVSDAKGMAVCICEGETLEEQAEKARLIAAAPELVEAVKLYRDELAKLLLSGWEMKAIDVTQEFEQIVGPILARVEGGGGDA